MSLKKALRQAVKSKRDLLRESERQKKADAVEEKLFNLPEFKNAKAILFFASFGSEIPTHKMMEDALKIGKRVILPITDTKTKRLMLREVRDLQSLQANKYGVPEPDPENTVEYEPHLVDLVIVPGIAFDLCGDRVGYGGGYYDRFLSSIDPTIPRISIAFEIQIVPKISREEHDLPVDKVITEERVIDTCEARLMNKNTGGTQAYRPK